MRGRLRALREGEEGFTLIEMLVAAIVLAVGIGATVVVLASSGKAGATAERHDIGVDQAQQAIEQIRALPYNQIGMTGLPPTGQSSPDPMTHVSGTNFNPIGSTQEALVLPGDSKVSSPQVAPYSTVTIGSGSTATTAKIYRFVSWRNESCGLLPANVTSLFGGTTTTALATLISNLGTANGTLGAALNGLVTNINGASSNLTGLLNVLLGAVLNAVSPNSPPNGILFKGTDLKPVAQAVLTALSSLSTQLNTLKTSLSSVGSISLCNLDLSVVQDFRTQLNKLTTTSGTGLLDPNTLNSSLNSVTTAAGYFGSAAGVNCGLLGLNCVVGSLLGNTLVNLNNNLNGVEPGLKNTLTNLTNGGTLTQAGTSITALGSDVGSLAASATNTQPKSSKRVTVAVVLKQAGTEVPLQPIWMSTVVADPNAGLL